MDLGERVEQALMYERELNNSLSDFLRRDWDRQELAKLMEEGTPYTLRYIAERAASEQQRVTAEKYVRILGAKLYNKYRKTEAWKAAKEDALELHRVLDSPELKKKLRHDLGYSRLRMWYIESPRRWCIKHPTEAAVIGLWGGAILSWLYDYVR